MRTSHRQHIVSGLGAALLSLCFVGCGGGSGESSAWTVDEGALTLAQDLLVAETESFYFGSVSDVAVASDGWMFVLDWDARHVKVLGPDGTLRDSIGREGEGPGEFQRPRQIVVARGDSLYVLDNRRDRVSVFTPEGTFAYGVQAESGGTFPEGLLVPDDRSGFVLSHSSFSPPGSSEEGAFTIRRIGGSARPADTILTARTRDLYATQRGDMMVFYFIPFGRRPHVAMGPEDRVHFGRNDSLRVRRYGLDGTRQGTVRVPFEPVPVTDEERTAELEDVQSEYRSAIRDRMPSTKPAFEHFLVDDEGRYWFGRPTANPDSTDWWVAWPEEKRVATTTLPNEVRLRVVRDGRAYGRTTTENGAPALVRYCVRVNP